MSDAAPQLPPEAGEKLLKSLFALYVEPELARRVHAGHPLAPGTPLYAIQVVFNVASETAVRLNDEVGGYMQVRAARDLKKGEPVMSNDITDITRVELTDADPDAAHMTAFYLSDGWVITWDARYNASLIASHLQAAGEFVVLAEVAFERGLLRGFVENAFHAAELLAKAAILALPDEVVLKAKTHTAVGGRFNRWAKLGNTDPRYAQLRNELEKLRAAGPYLRGEFAFDGEQAREMLATLKEMRSHTEEVSPRRTIASAHRQAVTRAAGSQRR
jgi:HEPN domain-containing protein